MTADTAALEPAKKLRFDWIAGVILYPKHTFLLIASLSSGVWLTPMLVLTLTTLGRVLTAGWIRQGIMLSAGPVLPPNFEFFSPEQQAQFMQATQATSGPVFVYVFPLIAALSGVWIGWLLVSGMLHLVVTLLGGRGETRYSINLVAWASLPFAVRDIVRVTYMLATHQLIDTAGLSGFAPASLDGGTTYLAALLSLIDIFLIWYLILMIIGVRVGNSLSMGKSIGGVVFTIGLVIALLALTSYLVSRLGGLTIIRPFF